MKFLRAIIVIFLFCIGAGSVQASSIILSNQVRGRECCDAGSLSAFSFQADTLSKLRLPATFALRYDAISESSITEKIRSTSTFEAAGFLEITPSLAKDAGVTYRGPTERWYKAGNAYLLGYSVDDRKKLLDTYMKKFKDVFGKHPDSTVAWMIDSWSLSYLEKTFAVKAHQITREQWGTDSYTLYGGPVNTPYFPAKSWPLLPAHTVKDSIPILMIRQTLMDPLFTYGDEQSAHTSQPNDYQFDGKDFSYFKSLLENALTSTYPNGFAVIGLETSMEEKFQQEFGRQLELIASLREQGKTEVHSIGSFTQTQKTNYVPGSLSAYMSPIEVKDKKAIWVNTPYYRARLIMTEKQVLISDLRVYSDTLEDPYAASSSATLNAYWTVPFVVDGSRFRVQQSQTLIERAQEIKARITSVKREASDYRRTINDLSGNGQGLLLPSWKQGTDPHFLYTKEKIEIKYSDVSGKNVTVRFLPETFEVDSPEKPHMTVADQRVQTVWDTRTIWLEEKQTGATTVFTPSLSPSVTMQLLTTKFPGLFSPESAVGDVDVKRSEFILVNKYAIVGRNPIRVVLRFVNEKGIPTLPNEDPDVQVSNSSIKTTISHPESASGEYYIDLEASEPLRTDVAISIASKKIELGEVVFAPNCLKSPLSCILHPLRTIDFIEAKWGDVSRKITSVL